MSNPQDALRQILPTVGWPSDAAADVAFTGGNDPVLPTPFRIGVAGAATVAAAGLAAAVCGSSAPGGASRLPSICARPRRRCAAAPT